MLAPTFNKGVNVKLHNIVGNTHGHLPCLRHPRNNSGSRFRLSYKLSYNRAAQRRPRVVPRRNATSLSSSSLSPKGSSQAEKQQVKTITTNLADQPLGSLAEFRVATYNILCPAYRRMGNARESEDEDCWKSRLARVVHDLKQTNADVLCLQEVWLANEEATDILKQALDEAGYDTYTTKRTSHWNAREDGLLTATRRSFAQVIDQVDIPFNDCGDRTAQLVWLKLHGGGQVAVVNLHLLFPHNANSTVIRLRETFKLLEFLEAWRQPNIPFVALGDWNGSERGRVQRFLRSQGWVSALKSCGISSTDDEETDEWISHVNHHGELVGVDHVLVLNPSVADTKDLAADWRRAVVAMMEAQLVQDGVCTTDEAFSAFDDNRNGVMDISEFRAMVERLGCTGEGSIGLLPHEIDEIFNGLSERDSCDDSCEIALADFRSWFDVETMASAYSRVRDTMNIEEGDWDARDLATSRAAPTCTLAPLECENTLPGELCCVAAGSIHGAAMSGEWPSECPSDHVPVYCDLSLNPQP